MAMEASFDVTAAPVQGTLGRPPNAPACVKHDLGRRLLFQIDF